MKTKSGFTLAEVLITLGIIGVVAAMTLPAVINKIGDRANINKLKREYSLYQQAFQQIAAENDFEFKNGLSNCTNTAQKSQHVCLKDLFKAKLKTIADCDSSKDENLSKCFVSQYDAKQLNGKPAGHYYFNGNGQPALVLEDGSSSTMFLDTLECTATHSGNKIRCGYIFVDVNGPKQQPNTLGRDLFLFFIYSDRIVPASSENTDATDLKDDCEIGTNYGMTCAGKYLYK